MYLSNGFFDWIINSRMLKYGVRIAKKYFSTFDGTSSYAALTDEIVLSGDFEIEVKINPASGFTGEQVVLGKSGQTYYFGYTPSVFFIKINGNYYILNTPPIVGEATNISVARNASNQISWFYEGNVNTISGNSSDIPINFIGKNSVTGNVHGQLSDLKIWDGGGQYDSGELYSFEKMGGDPVSTLTQVGVDGFNYDATTEQDDRIYLNLTTVAGVKYRLEYNEITSVTGSIFARDGVNGGGTVLNSSAFSGNSLEFIAASTTTTLLFDGNTNVFSFNFRGLSVRSVVGNLILDLPMSEGLKDVYDEVFYRNRVQAQAEWLLTSNANSQIEFQDIALSGDFEIEVDYKSLSTGNTILGFSDDTALYYQNSSNVSFRVKDTSGTDVYGGSTPLSVGVAARVVFKLDNGVFRCSVNGVFGSSRDMSTTKKSTYYFNSLAGGNPFNDSNNISNLKIWQGGDRTTGTLIIDSALNDNGNIIANAASPVNANVWSAGTEQIIGDSEVLSDTSVRIYSPTGGFSEVKYFTGVLGTDYLVTVTTDGNINTVLAGENSTQSSGWVNVRDEYGQPTNTYQTLTNNPNVNSLVLKRVGVADIVLTDISFVEVEGYGVLQGTRNTDYEWTNETPHAIGYNVTTTANN